MEENGKGTEAGAGVKREGELEIEMELESHGSYPIEGLKRESYAGF